MIKSLNVCEKEWPSAYVIDNGLKYKLSLWTKGENFMMLYHVTNMEPKIISNDSCVR